MQLFNNYLTDHIIEVFGTYFLTNQGTLILVHFKSLQSSCKNKFSKPFTLLMLLKLLTVMNT